MSNVGDATYPETSRAADVAPPARSETAALQTVFLVRHAAFDQSFGLLSLDTGPQVPGGRLATGLTCERAYFAGGRGICLMAGRPLIDSYSAVFFDASFKAGATVPIDGIPSRARVSPDGRLAAATVFVEGHSYADATFSTVTTIFDTVTSQPILANLEELIVHRDGEPFRQSDFNFWGVTFAGQAGQFYATLGTKTTSYLIRGDVQTKSATVLVEHVDCPSISPDNTRLAFKKPYFVQNQPAWRLHVLDLETFAEIPLAESRSVDDQVEWLDNSRILYSLSEQPGTTASNVWMVPADGSGAPELFMKNASSPVVVQWSSDRFPISR